MRRIAWLCADPGIRYGGTKGACRHLEQLSSAVAAHGARVLLIVSAVEPGAPAPPEAIELQVIPDGHLHRGGRPGSDGRLGEWVAQHLRRFGADTLYERFALHTAAGTPPPPRAVCRTWSS